MQGKALCPTSPHFNPFYPTSVKQRVVHKRTFELPLGAMVQAERIGWSVFIKTAAAAGDEAHVNDNSER